MDEKEKPGQVSETSGQETNKRINKTELRPYLYTAMSIILVVVVCLAIFFIIYRFQGLVDGIKSVANSLQSVLFGFIIAYLINPIMKFCERNFNKKMFLKNPERTRRQKRIIRGLSVAIAMVIFLAILTILIMMIIPQLITTVQDLVTNMSGQVTAMMDWLDKLTKQDINDNSMVSGLVQDAFDYVQDWLENHILSTDSSIMSTITQGVYTALRTIVNFIIGLIIAVYVLMTKERFIGQAKKIIYAIFRPRWGNAVEDFFHKANEVFGGFFIGKIIDSVIIGFLCFAGVSILRLPYAVLISVIVGVTNVIPFFGPYIGAIPCALLLFLTNPIYALYFIIFIFVLQQIDGNIIGPKILGDSTGLSPFWVIVAILLFGGQFGVAGMIFGVPVLAMIYYVIKRIVDHFLQVRGLPVDTATFVTVRHVNLETNEPVHWDRQHKRKPLFEKWFTRRKTKEDPEDPQS